MNNKKGIKNIFELIIAIVAVLALLNLDSIVNFIRNKINKINRRRMITIKSSKENSNISDELTEVPLFIKVLTSKFEDHSINDLVDVSYYNKSSDSELLDPIFSTPITCSTSRIKGGEFYCKKDLPVIITINNFIAQNTNREFSPNLNLVISKTNKNGFDDKITFPPFNKNPYIRMIGFCAHENLVDIDFLLDMESIFETEINDEETITSIDITVNLDCDV